MKSSRPPRYSSRSQCGRLRRGSTVPVCRKCWKMALSAYSCRKVPPDPIRSDQIRSGPTLKANLDQMALSAYSCRKAPPPFLTRSDQIRSSRQAPLWFQYRRKAPKGGFSQGVLLQEVPALRMDTEDSFLQAPIAGSCRSKFRLHQVPVAGSCRRFLLQVPVAGSCCGFLSQAPAADGVPVAGYSRRLQSQAQPCRASMAAA